MDNPKYLIMSCSEADKKLSFYSCFGVYNSLLAIDKGILTISTLRDGNLLILVKSKLVADKFMKRNDLPGICRINTKLHGSLNFVKGSIYAPYLNDVSEEEIVKEQTPIKVVAAHKFSKIIDGTPKPSGVVLLTFDLFHLPKKIQVAWNNSLVKEYIPNPMRCKTFQRLGILPNTNNSITTTSYASITSSNSNNSTSNTTTSKNNNLKNLTTITKTNTKDSNTKIFESNTSNITPTTSFSSITPFNSNNLISNTTTSNNNNKKNLTTNTKTNTNESNTNNSTNTNNNKGTKTTQHSIKKPVLPVSTTISEPLDIEITPQTTEPNINKESNNNYTYFTIPANLQTTSLNKSKISSIDNALPNNTTLTIDQEHNTSKEDSHSYNLRSSTQYNKTT